MKAIDVNSLFARAEQAFAAGRLEEARTALGEVQRLAGDHPAVLHLTALVAKRRGDLAAARAAFERALRLAPGDPQILNNFANLLQDLNLPEEALETLGRALAAAPGFHDARYNQALLLEKMGRLEEALADLDVVLRARPGDTRGHSARGSVLRRLNRLEEAAAAYEAALRIEPRRAVALHGRARVALERGEDRASDHYRRALLVQPTDPTLLLGLAEALEAEGGPGAIEALASAVAARPTWSEGQASLARMRWEAGEGAEFARAFEQAVADHPANRDLWFAYAAALGAADLHEQAADVARRGRAAADGADGPLTLLEAIHASEAGDEERATALFSALPGNLPGNELHRIRHLLRLGDYEAAVQLADRARAADPADVGAWAATGLLWRLLGDPRRLWLHEQPGLVDTRELDLGTDELAGIAEQLRLLHRTRAHPIGQSLRGGTQTRGRLFERGEPAVIRLRDAIAEAVSDYWRGLPQPDESHPLLRHRARAPRFDGSWSVRLTGGGYHISHIHPNGALSSACYLVVPDTAEQEGWLEIGGPPAGLDLPLEPLRLVQPVPGRLALFPSTLYHETRPFPAGERLTVAFDVVAA